MALITKDITLTVDGKNASLSEEIYVYVGDRNIDINFTIVDAKYKFGDGGGNIISQIPEGTLVYSRVLLKKPGAEDGITDVTTGFSQVKNGVVTFTIDEEVCDAIEEKGTHELQIQLYSIISNSGSPAISGRVTIPPVKFDVLEPIFEDGINLGDFSIDSGGE